MRVVTECQTSGPNPAETKEIRIVVNGESRTVPEALTVLGLLERLELDPARVAVELNREIVRLPSWNSTHLLDGSELEIVQFVGGG
jgi:sulfur carrier protein